MNRPRVLLADDHPVLIQGLRRLLEDQFEIVGAVVDGLALVKAAGELRPDIIVADISMPLLNGIDAARRIRKDDPAAKIIFLTMHSDVPYAIEALNAGAFGYVLKNAAGQLLVTAIQEALEGRIFIAPDLAPIVANAQSARRSERDNDGEGLTGAIPLTARQREIARLIMEGRTIKEIGGLLNLSTRTIEFHKYRAMAALELKSVAELVQFAVKYLA